MNITSVNTVSIKPDIEINHFNQYAGSWCYAKDINPQGTLLPSDLDLDFRTYLCECILVKMAEEGRYPMEQTTQIKLVAPPTDSTLR
jgi:hypothetical protein